MAAGAAKPTKSCYPLSKISLINGENQPVQDGFLIFLTKYEAVGASLQILFIDLADKKRYDTREKLISMLKRSERKDRKSVV